MLHVFSQQSRKYRFPSSSNLFEGSGGGEWPEQDVGPIPPVGLSGFVAPQGSCGDDCPVRMQNDHGHLHTCVVVVVVVVACSCNICCHAKVLP